MLEQVHMITFLSAAREPWGAEQSMVTLASHLSKRGQSCRLITSGAAVQQLWHQLVNNASCLVDPGLRSYRAASLVALTPDDDAVVTFSLALSPLPVLLRTSGRRPRRWILDLHDWLPTR